MRFLRRLVVFLVVLFGAAIGVACVLPNSAHVERSITINRPASEIFGVLNNLHRFNAWSPWFDIDPNATYSFSGPARGVGSKLSWAGNADVGSGSMEILEANPGAGFKIGLDFGPMGRPISHFALSPAGVDGTKVVWSFDAGLPLGFDGRFVWNVVGRYMGLFMDKMVGSDYAKGLAKLRNLVETFPAADISGFDGEEVMLAPQKIYFISASADANTAQTVLTDAYTRLDAFAKANRMTMAGAPMTITTSHDPASWKFDAAYPVDRNDAPGSGDIRSGATYAGKAVQFLHVGAYETIGETTTKAFAWLAVQGYRSKDRLIEEYLNSPATVPPDQLQTRIKIPVE